MKMDGFVVGDQSQYPIVITISVYPGILQVLEGWDEVRYIGWTNPLSIFQTIEQFLRDFKLAQIYWNPSSEAMQKPSCNLVAPRRYTPNTEIIAQLPGWFLNEIGY